MLYLISYDLENAKRQDYQQRRHEVSQRGPVPVLNDRSVR